MQQPFSSAHARFVVDFWKAVAVVLWIEKCKYDGLICCERV